MKLLRREDLVYRQLFGNSTGEVYSQSSLVSERLGSAQLSIHQDVIAPGKRSSAPHRHTKSEEVVFVVKGTATVVCGSLKYELPEGSWVLFAPADEENHVIENRTSEGIVTITFSRMSTEDQVRY